MPKMMPPCICASIVFGLTTMPQSTAHTTRFTATSPLIDGHVRDDREEAAERVHDRYAAPLPLRQRIAPAGGLRGDIEHVRARGVLPSRSWRYLTGSTLACAASSSIKLSTTKVPRVGPTPRQNAVGTIARFLAHVVDQLVRQVVGKVGRDFHGVRIDSVLERGRREARQDRRADNPVLPRNRLAVRIEAGRDHVVVVRAIHVVLDVFFARPQRP